MRPLLPWPRWPIGEMGFAIYWQLLQQAAARRESSLSHERRHSTRDSMRSRRLSLLPLRYRDEHSKLSTTTSTANMKNQPRLPPCPSCPHMLSPHAYAHPCHCSQGKIVKIRMARAGDQSGHGTIAPEHKLPRSARSRWQQHVARVESAISVLLWWRLLLASSRLVPKPPWMSPPACT